MCLKDDERIKLSNGWFKLKLWLLIKAGYFTIEVVTLLIWLKTAGFLICALADKNNDPAPPILKQEGEVNAFLFACTFDLIMKNIAKGKGNGTEREDEKEGRRNLLWFRWIK